MLEAVMGAHVVTVNEVLDGHVALDIQCLDRIYLNAYVMKLQTSAQVVAFLSGHLGFPFPSPALFTKIGERFRRAVTSYAETNDIPWIKFGKDDDKLATMAPHLRRQAATGCSGVAAIGVAQEFQRVWSATEGQTSTGTPRWSFYKADRRVTCYYFYVWDEDFGPAFIKLCAYFPYPGKVWINGHEWAKRQATKAGIGFTELSNGFASCDDPQALQTVCDRLGPGTINVFVQRWLARLPVPFTRKDQDGGYWWETSLRQVEISRTIVFDAPATPAASSKPSSWITRPGPPPQRGNHLRPPGTPRHPRHLPHRDRPPRQRRRATQRVLPPLPHQAVPQRRPRHAHRDRHQPHPRPGLQRPPTQPRRPADQGPCVQPQNPGCATCRSGLRPRESSL